MQYSFVECIYVAQFILGYIYVTLLIAEYIYVKIFIAGYIYDQTSDWRIVYYYVAAMMLLSALVFFLYYGIALCVSKYSARDKATGTPNKRIETT